MESSGMLRRVALVRTEFSKELSASVIMVIRIGELGTTLAVTSNRRRSRFRRRGEGKILESTGTGNSTLNKIKRLDLDLL
jgi:hypothetical protein